MHAILATASDSLASSVNTGLLPAEWPHVLGVVQVVTNAGKSETRTAVIDDHDMLWQELRNLHIAEVSAHCAGSAGNDSLPWSFALCKARVKWSLLLGSSRFSCCRDDSVVQCRPYQGCRHLA